MPASESMSVTEHIISPSAVRRHVFITDAVPVFDVPTLIGELGGDQDVP
ncbi:MAG: hypothetical protein AB2L11_11370 [Syntrophobacteraceae bacterium]